MVAMKPMRSSAWIGWAVLLLALGLTYIVRGEATGGGDRPKLPERLPPAIHPPSPPEGAAEHPVHPEACDSCQAGDIWKAFVEHMKEIGRGDLVPAPPAEKEEPEGEPGTKAVAKTPKVDLQSTDPIRGVLFKVSKDLVNLDALFEEPHGAPLDAAAREKARGLIEKVRSEEDPYLKAYGELHGARLDLEEGKTESAVKALEGLVKSCTFLPRREARRHLARAYRARGDDTLAILEIQFFLSDLPPQNETDRSWARDELKTIRDKKHEGPLHDSETSMRSISDLLTGLEVGEPTQAKERRVEDILDKVAKLLDLRGVG